MPFSRRDEFIWKLRSRSLSLGPRTLVMGVLNVTPDSFSDGGRFLYPATAAANALRMIEQGADIIDIGGESTRPGNMPTLAQRKSRAAFYPSLTPS